MESCLGPIGRQQLTFLQFAPNSTISAIETIGNSAGAIVEPDRTVWLHGDDSNNIGTCGQLSVWIYDHIATTVALVDLASVNAGVLSQLSVDHTRIS